MITKEEGRQMRFLSQSSVPYEVLTAYFEPPIGRLKEEQQWNSGTVIEESAAVSAIVETCTTREEAEDESEPGSFGN